MKSFYTFIAEVEDVAESLEGDLLIMSSNCEGVKVVDVGHPDVAVEGGEELEREPLVGGPMNPHKGGEPSVFRHPCEVGGETTLGKKAVAHPPRGMTLRPLSALNTSWLLPCLIMARGSPSPSCCDAPQTNR